MVKREGERKAGAQAGLREHSWRDTNV